MSIAITFILVPVGAYMMFRGIRYASRKHGSKRDYMCVALNYNGLYWL